MHKVGFLAFSSYCWHGDLTRSGRWENHVENWKFEDETT